MIILIFFLFFWVAPVWLCASICEQRNRNMGKGMLVGFLTGWFGTIWLLMFMKDKSENNPAFIS